MRVRARVRFRARVRVRVRARARARAGVRVRATARVRVRPATPQKRCVCPSSRPEVRFMPKTDATVALTWLGLG